MESGRGDRNQVIREAHGMLKDLLQWGPVVVTGVSPSRPDRSSGGSGVTLQWGPVVVTGIREAKSL